MVVGDVDSGFSFHYSYIELVKEFFDGGLVAGEVFGRRHGCNDVLCRPNHR